MVRPVNKWLVLLVMGWIFLTSATQMGPRDANSNAGFHPLHVSTTEINHNTADKTLEITARIFMDDFEACLSKQFHVKADLSAATAVMDSLVNKYISSHLRIKADGKALSYRYIGFEKDGDAINSYFEATNLPGLKKVEIGNSILHDLYTDQMNIIHVVVGGNRKSTKLDYPVKEAVFGF